MKNIVPLLFKTINNRLPLVWKVFLPLGFLALIGVTVSLTLLSNAQKSAGFLYRLYEHNMRANIHLSNLENLLAEHHNLLLEHFAAEDAIIMRLLTGKINATQNSITNVIKSHSEQHDHGDYLGPYSPLHKLYLAYKAKGKMIIDLSQDFDKEAAFSIMQTEAIPLIRQINALVSEQRSKGDKTMEIFYRQASESTRKSAIIAWCFVAISLVVPVVIAFFLASFISHHVNAFISYAREIGKGKLDAELIVNSEDEFGQLGDNLKVIGKNLTIFFNKLQLTNQKLESQTIALEKSENNLRLQKQELETSNKILEKMQVTFNDLLIMTLEELSLDELMKQFIEKITFLPELNLSNMGAIFLIENDPNLLVMKGSHNLALPLHEICKVVPLGRCLCGRAAKDGKVLFASCVDERHDNTFDDILPHGHYCVPIYMPNHELCGVFTVYVYDGAKENQQVKDFLVSSASILGGIIQYRRTEEEKKEAEGDKLKLQAQLRQAQKMESIGTLAGGIAHDFNNILTAILGYGHLVKDAVKSDPQTSEDMDQVITAGNRAKNLVKQILTFSRQSEQELIPLQLSPIVKEALKLLRSSIPSTIEIKHNIQASEKTVLADPTQIHQITMNICTNAYQAMPNGGTLKVTLENKQPEPSLLQANLNMTGDSFVCLSISDTGTGIDSECLARIFEPYFSTKKKDDGTGLGLSVVHGIVTGMGGGIAVTSNPVDGTTFSVYLPLMLEDPSEIIEEKRNIPTGFEHILFVDDELPIVTLTKRRLESLRYKVSTRMCSVEALNAFANHPNRYDLVITDQTMPNMTGSVLAGEMIKIRPDIPIILVTGYAEIGLDEKVIAAGVVEVLHKPVSKEQLAITIRKVLDDRTREV